MFMNISFKKTETTMKTKMLLGFALVIALVSCKKLEDGPAFSINTRKNRLCDDWKAEKILSDGKDITSEYSIAELSFSKNGRCSQDWKTSSGEIAMTGKWIFTERHSHIWIDWDQGSHSDFLITRLTKKELWMKDGVDASNMGEIHLIPR